MGMIRVSDGVEAHLKEVADGRSMNAIIEKMLAYCSSPAGFCPAPQESQGAANYEPYLLEHMDKRFDELKSLIEDTAVDRVDGPKFASKSHLCIRLPWEGCMQDIYFDFEDGDPCWMPGVKEAWGESDYMDTVAFESDGEYIYDVTANRVPILKVTPTLRSYLDKKGFEV